jgi:hypothetical protein
MTMKKENAQYGKSSTHSLRANTASLSGPAHTGRIFLRAAWPFVVTGEQSQSITDPQNIGTNVFSREYTLGTSLTACSFIIILLLVGCRNNNQVKQSDCPLATRDQLWVPDILSDSPTLIVRLKGSSNCRSGALQANRTEAGRFGFDLGWQDSVTTRTAPPAVDEQFLQ